MAQSVGASPSGLCRTECPRFELRSYYKLCLSKFHLVLCLFGLLVCSLVLRSPHKPLAHKTDRKKMDRIR